MTTWNSSLSEPEFQPCERALRKDATIRFAEAYPTSMETRQAAIPDEHVRGPAGDAENRASRRHPVLTGPHARPRPPRTIRTHHVRSSRRNQHHHRIRRREVAITQSRRNNLHCATATACGHTDHATLRTGRMVDLSTIDPILTFQLSLKQSILDVCHGIRA